ncbi:MAG TPA: cbb3-type cytochrome c oxidase subunit 3 [Casimicrobiaceae bacterium]|nr:cbb3-type cytochrome c oxidase subunit 3 [Casimicrobiaceae bacterium]
MSPVWGQVVGVATVIVMLAFAGVWAWAWLPQHKDDFDALSKLPMEDEPEAIEREAER